MHDKGFDIAKSPKYDGYQSGLDSMIYICFDKKNILVVALKSENISNKELAEELHKPIIRNFNKRKVYPSFIDNIWVAHLADIQLISKFNKRLRYLLCVIDIYSKYAQVNPLNNKKGITIANAFQKILKDYNHKPNKISVDKDSEFYNRSVKSWLEKKWYRNVFNT